MKKLIIYFSLIFSIAAKAQLCFNPIDSFAVSTNPAAICINDFNGDGYKDVIIANSAAGNIAQFLGNSNNIFSAPTYTTVGVTPSAIASNDFNGDLKYDIVVANSGSNSISVFLNSGSATYTISTYQVGSQPDAVFIADVNSDNKKDIVIANYGSNTISVLIGSGTGSFSSAANYSVGTQPTSVYCADFNGDNKKDIVVTNYGQNNVSVLLNNGLGSFSSAVNFAVGTQPSAVTSADFNNDTKFDIATANFGSSDVSILLGDGLGGFSSATNISVGTQPTAIVSADFNNDVKMDIATTNKTSNNVSVLNGNGTGGFSAPVNFSVGAQPVAITAADFNSDSNVDLFSANFLQNSFSVLNGNGTGGFAAAKNYSSKMGPSNLINGHFNNDANVDIAVVNYNSSTLSVLFGDGAGNFSAPTINKITANSVGAINSADFNEDGLSDIVLGNINVNVYLNTGNGIFSTPNTYTTTYNTSFIDIADFNNDNHKDLAVLASSYFYILLGHGDGTFTVSSTTYLGSSGVPKGVVADDFNADGKPDVAITLTGSSSGYVSIRLGDGAGNVGSPNNYTAGQYGMVIRSGDFDGDGNRDLVQIDIIANTVDVFIGNGTGNFYPGVYYNYTSSPGSFPYSGTLNVADINKDGKTDIICTNTGIQSISSGYYPNVKTITVLLSNGTGFYPYTTFTVGENPGAVISDDFNNDGKPDLATANSGSYDPLSIDGNNITVLLSCMAGVGITNFNTGEKNFTTYPNPAQNNFTVEVSNNDKQTLQLFDVNGKLVLTQTINGKTNIDATNLSAGVYNLNITSSNGLANKRLVIVK
ncbi:MAG TPA: T9SS type A sorting domain-containing protein [Bacteroidia bacterium]|nr:T9SS type A sorting domain-containing protein [Bacteroidia bacterium]